MNFYKLGNCRNWKMYGLANENLNMHKSLCHFSFQIKKDETNVAISLLARVSGIGPAKAKELVDVGIKSLEDLKKHQDKLTHHQKLGLKYEIDLSMSETF